jgi:hypothetical protein
MLADGALDFAVKDGRNIFGGGHGWFSGGDGRDALSGTCD